VAPTGTNAPLWSRFVAPTGTKDLFSGAQCAGNRDLWSRLVQRTGTKGVALVPVCPTNRDQCTSFVPVGATNRDQRPARCGGMFSPTSLVERAREWFISAAAPTLSSSSQLQAFGPTLLLFARGPAGPL